MTDEQKPLDDLEIATTEGAMAAIKAAVADGDDELLGGILFTRQMWAYDKGLYERTHQILGIISNDLTAMKKRVRQELAPNPRLKPHENVERGMARKAAVDIVAACQDVLVEHVKVIQYASDTFTAAYGAGTDEEE